MFSTLFLSLGESGKRNVGWKRDVFSYSEENKTFLYYGVFGVVKETSVACRYSVSE